MSVTPADVGPVALVSYCQLAQSLGVSQREALRVARAWGLTIRTDTFRVLWHAADDAMRTFGFPGVERR